MTQSNIGKVIKVEWDQDTDEVRITLEITDTEFKSRILHSKEFEDILTINGRDLIVVAKKGAS